SIRAEGQVYLINRSGIVFGGSAQVNVGTLTLSGLDILPAQGQTADDRFLRGTLTSLDFGGPGGPVSIEAGAKIQVSPFGRATLFGPVVSNHGTIEAPDGQVILAAGSTVDLQGADLGLRGLAQPLVDGAGLVDNGGVISTPRGNITMLAEQTLQNGLLTATTGAEGEGPTHLGFARFHTTLGSRSVTQVVPDLGGKKVIGEGAFKRSSIEIHGETITVLDSATIYAPSGSVSLSAKMMTDPTGAGIDTSRIYLGSGARI